MQINALLSWNPVAMVQHRQKESLCFETLKCFLPRSRLYLQPGQQSLWPPNPCTIFHSDIFLSPHIWALYKSHGLLLETMPKAWITDPFSLQPKQLPRHISAYPLIKQHPFPGLNTANLPDSNQCKKTKVTFLSCHLEYIVPFSKCFLWSPLLYFMKHKLVVFAVKTFIAYPPLSITSEHLVKGQLPCLMDSADRHHQTWNIFNSTFELSLLNFCKAPSLPSLKLFLYGNCNAHKGITMTASPQLLRHLCLSGWATILPLFFPFTHSSFHLSLPLSLALYFIKIHNLSFFFFPPKL